MNIFQTITSLPLGILPIATNLFGIYWIAKICLTPSRRWLTYYNSNSIAIYCLSATLAIGLVYGVRSWFNPPAYYSGMNWTPPIAALLTYLIAELIDSTLALRLQYKPLQQRMIDKLLATIKTKGWENLRTEQLRAVLFTSAFTVMAVFLIPDTDVAKGTYRSRGLILALGNTNIQAGIAWSSAIIIAIFLAATVLSFGIDQKKA